MKCKMIQDLLPLYIDGLTSEESNQEIEKHLKNCKECQICYREMTGEIGNAVSITDEEIKEIDLIKKVKKRNKIKRAGVIISIFILVSIIGILFFLQKSRVKYEDVELTYGVRGNKAYFEMETKPGYTLHFTGSAGGNNSKLKILAIKKIVSSQKDNMGWETDLGTADNPCRWTIEFEDKIIVIENGKLVEEKEK